MVHSGELFWFRGRPTKNQLLSTKYKSSPNPNRRLEAAFSVNNKSNRYRLIVEDNAQVLLILRAVLEKLGDAYRIAAAGDGRDVLTKAKNQPLDLLISDVGMTDVEHPSTVGSYLIKKESQSSGKKDFFERGSVSEKVDLRKTVHPARAVF